MNRREFLKAAMAAAAAAYVPDFTTAEAAAAYDRVGIEDYGNGWYRCYIRDIRYYDEKLDNATLQAMSNGIFPAREELEHTTASVFAKAGELLHGKRDGKVYRSNLMMMRAGRVEVYFDLEKGEIASVGVDKEIKPLAFAPAGDSEVDLYAPLVEPHWVGGYA